MKKYLVINYYNWDGDFGVDISKPFDTKAQATQRQTDLVGQGIRGLSDEGETVLINAQDLPSEVIDGLESPYLVEHYNESYIITQYGNSAMKHEEIVIKEIEV